MDGKPRSRQWPEFLGVQWLVETIWSQDGIRLEPLSVTVTSPDPDSAPVSAEVLRRLPIGSLHQRARQVAAGITKMVPNNRPALPEVDHLLAALEKSGAHRGVATSAQELEILATVYVSAYQAGESVTQAVADYFGISKSTAGKRIMKARTNGLLPRSRRLTR